MVLLWYTTIHAALLLGAYSHNNFLLFSSPFFSSFFSYSPNPIRREHVRTTRNWSTNVARNQPHRHPFPHHHLFPRPRPGPNLCWYRKYASAAASVVRRRVLQSGCLRRCAQRCCNRNRQPLLLGPCRQRAMRDRRFAGSIRHTAEGGVSSRRRVLRNAGRLWCGTSQPPITLFGRTVREGTAGLLGCGVRGIADVVWRCFVLFCFH